MMTSKRETRRISKIYGDFQTPLPLASDVARHISRLGFTPRTVIEPTCGQGSFLIASLDTFLSADRFLGIDIDSNHLSDCSSALQHSTRAHQVDLHNTDIFKVNWNRLLTDMVDPVLIVGNPPWVTNSAMSAANGNNTPAKSNFKRERGINAMTGKGNFDISEWILLNFMEWFRTRDIMLAMLCKTSVARKALSHAWKHNYRISESMIYRIDAKRHFNVDVDACLLVARSGNPTYPVTCKVYPDIASHIPDEISGYDDGAMIADLKLYQRTRHLRGRDPHYVWRSGLKHDCSNVMELTKHGNIRYNGHRTAIDIEDSHVYPLYKSSDIASPHRRNSAKFVIVPQQNVGDDTANITNTAPRTWGYLQEHKAELDRRRSSIYRGRPPFSIFGIGEYAFTPWKVAISGFYKKLDFVVIPPSDGKPAMVDDTVYYLPCQSEPEASCIVEMLNSDPAKNFLRSMIYWSDKRPITAGLLRRLNISALADELGRSEDYQSFRIPNTNPSEQLHLIV